MESVGDFLCGIFMTMYWIFRLIVTAISYLQIEFPFECINTNAEILLLFLTLICIILCLFWTRFICKNESRSNIRYYG